METLSGGCPFRVSASLYLLSDSRGFHGQRRRRRAGAGSGSGSGSGARGTCPRGAVKMLRQAYAQAEEFSVEREHLITDLQFQQSGLREREEISQARLQQICKDEEHRKRVVEADTGARLGARSFRFTATISS